MLGPIAPLDVTLSNLERPKSRQGHSDFEPFYLMKESTYYLAHILLLNLNGKPYMESPMAVSHLTLKGQGHSYFKALYLVKEPS